MGELFPKGNNMLLKSETISKYEIVFTYFENNFQQILFQNRDFFRRASRVVKFSPVVTVLFRGKSAPQARKNVFLESQTRISKGKKRATGAKKNMFLGS